MVFPTGNPFLALAQLVQQDPAQAAVLAASSGLVPPAQPATAGPPSFVAAPGAGPGGPAGGGGATAPAAPIAPVVPGLPATGPGGGIGFPGLVPPPSAPQGGAFGVAPNPNPATPFQQIAGFPVAPGAGAPAGTPASIGDSLGLALRGLKAIEGPETRVAPAANPSGAIPQGAFQTPDIQQLIALLLGGQGGDAGGTSAGIPSLGALIGG